MLDWIAGECSDY